MTESNENGPKFNTVLLQQPEIKVLPFADPLSWADDARVQYEWLKQVIPQINAVLPKGEEAYNVEMLLRGQVLSMILTDDSNCFNLAASSKESFEELVRNGVIRKENLERPQRRLLHRLNWEVGVPELDERIRAKIREILPFLSSQNPWHKWEDLQAAYKEWLKVKQLSTQLLNEEPQLKEAFHYYNKRFFDDENLKSMFDDFLLEKRRSQEARNP